MKQPLNYCKAHHLFCAVLLFLLLLTIPSHAQNLNISMRGATIKEVMNYIQTNSKYTFVYNSLINVSQKINLSADNKPVKDILDEMFKGTDITYTIMDNQIVLSKKGTNSSKTPVSQKKVTGYVHDNTGIPLAGVFINVKGSTNGVLTGQDGDYSINAKNLDTLVFTFLGMKTKEEIVSKNLLNIVMEDDSFKLNEVVLTGYQSLSKERAAGSFSVISKDDISKKLNNNIMDRLEGSIVGMTNYKGNLQIRGTSTLIGNDSPIYIVDGVPYEGSIATINPAEITNVTVLKDASAASIYGSRSANGVIVITTKGGEVGKTKVAYNGSIAIKGLPDTDYYNLMNSEEFIDFQRTLFNLNSGSELPSNYYMNEVRTLLFQNKKGAISNEQMETALNKYKQLDRSEQIKDEFLRKLNITHQHNLSVSGGSDIYKYAASINYNQSFPYEKAQSSDRIGVNLKNSFDFYKWFKVDLSLMGNHSNSSYYNGFSGMSYLTGSSMASYLMLRDENGEPMNWYKAKSQSEIDRLKGLGLIDETFCPIDELKRQRFTSKTSYLNANLNLKFIIMDGLSIDLRYQNEVQNYYSKQLYNKDSWFVRTMVNDATQIQDGEVIQNIPTGGQVVENRGDKNSYTMRAQINYNTTFNNKHNITAIAGAERRAVKSTSTGVYKVGYDDQSKSYKAINEKLLGTQLKGTESLSGSYTYNNLDPGFASSENRYVSFYGNVSYIYNRRASFTASIRMDQSNLFGTDPKYQYKPLWSIGGKYIIFNKLNNWMDHLAVRATYGINGNIAKESGPYLTVSDTGINGWINDYSSKVVFPPNSGLRWEKTKALNLAIDFDLLSYRLGGSIEFYNKSTTDLLYNKTIDPTYGWNSLMVNYGDMYNRGFEVSLKSVNIENKNLKWETNLNFSYNKNKITKVQNNKIGAINYVNSTQIRENMPMNGLYSCRWAGLDEKGAPLAYKKDGTIVSSFANLTIDDLVYSGTTVPPYSASLSNFLTYRQFSLSFMFTYYGGHVMRGVFGRFLNGSGLSTNQDKLTGNFWQQAGDENDPDKAPAFKQSASADIQNLWNAADKHIQKGDYIKLHEVILSYRLPAKALKSIKLSGLTLSLQANNLWKWVANDMDLDPEVWTGTSLSPSRGTKVPTTYTFGLSINF